MTTRKDLDKSGDLFVKSFKACLDWLALGGDIELKSGHIIMMTDDGRPGFWAISQKGADGPKEEILLQVDSEVVWSYLVDHARKMTEENFTVLCMNLALNNK